MVDLSEKTSLLISRLFVEEQWEAVGELLRHECSDNLPFATNYDAEQLERIRFAVIKESMGEFDKLVEFIRLAKVDWRDLLLSSGFSKDVEEHKLWAQKTINDN